MAHPSIRLDYVCRSCRNILREHKIASIAGSQFRSFSSTRLQNKTLATFTPTSNQELDAILSDWRSRVFIPSILSDNHRALIFKTKNKELLLNPPGVTASVAVFIPPHADRSKFTEEEERIKLQPMAPNEHMNITKGLLQVAECLKQDSSATTWDNLIPFFYGLAQADIMLRHEWLSKLCRIANGKNDGRWTTLLEAAAQCRKTKFTLSMIDPTRELVFGALWRAVQSNFEDAEPAHTLERIVQLMEKDEHCNHKIPRKVKHERQIFADMRKDPMLLATRLALRSAAALRENGGRDTTGAVAGDIAKLIAFDGSTPRGLIGFASKAYYTPEKEMTAGTDFQDRLQDLTIVYCGLALASKIDLKAHLGKEQNTKTTVELQKLLQNIKPQVADAKVDVEKSDVKRLEKNALNKPARALTFLEDVEKAVKSF